MTTMWNIKLREKDTGRSHRFILWFDGCVAAREWAARLAKDTGWRVDSVKPDN